ncbi:hypothetical protein OOT46_29150 [Aquabacterium sp. A7-Y]|uniref:hypothetical protein n=1 Tax=Aquabacterium sp. A7-Y TaxID=1349605 RepID=UPI00223E77E5|nr:hypothetical protein [Aquabacterium sp. A7-Y]MCW7541869.1 hypothetical protein [Aquabacterium sp. A7-Y]
MTAPKKTLEQVAQKASICLKDRENIPTAPLWHMGKAYVFSSNDSFDLVQNTIDYLACKAKLGRAFTEDEKELLVNLYEALWWGGKIKGTPEAATLANHYVHGNGKEIRLDPSIYRDSVIVQDAMVCLKKYIADRQAKGKTFSIIKTTDADFRLSKFADPLRLGRRNQNTQGNIVAKDGALKTEEINRRLKFADNRFHLVASTSYTKPTFFTRWSVDSLYDFVDYAENKDDQHITRIPMDGGRNLILPDGLSSHMEKIGIAKRFWHRAEWHEQWRAA